MVLRLAAQQAPGLHLPRVHLLLLLGPAGKPWVLWQQQRQQLMLQRRGWRQQQRQRRVTMIAPR